MATDSAQEAAAGKPSARESPAAWEEVPIDVASTGRIAALSRAIRCAFTDEGDHAWVKSFGSLVPHAVDLPALGKSLTAVSASEPCHPFQLLHIVGNWDLAGADITRPEAVVARRSDVEAIAAKGVDGVYLPAGAVISVSDYPAQARDNLDYTPRFRARVTAPGWFFSVGYFWPLALAIVSLPPGTPGLHEVVLAKELHSAVMNFEPSKDVPFVHCSDAAYVRVGDDEGGALRYPEVAAPSPGDHSFSAMMTAINSGDVAGVKALMTTSSCARREEVLQAVRSRSADVLAALLTKDGAELANAEGPHLLDRPLASATTAEVVRVLVDAGAALFAPDLHGNTALMRAAAAGNTEVVRALLDAATDLGRRAPIAAATDLGRRAPIAAANDDGHTALDLARANGHGDCAAAICVACAAPLGYVLIEDEGGAERQREH